MEIGIDDLDEFDDLEGYEEPSGDNLDNDGNGNESPVEEVNIIDDLLKAQGIEDSSKIKFENEDGEIEEKDWNDLSYEDQLNILKTKESNSDDLDQDEIALINAVRNSKMSPQEYINFIQQQAVSNYHAPQPQANYEVDDISDDELFMLDLLSKAPDLTDEEVQEALESAKANENVFNKQIGALRSEYKRLENDKVQEEQYQRQAEAQEQFNQFAGSVENSIRGFNEFAGLDINMEPDDMQELYEFITGFDAAGNSHFGKALNDPNTLVKMAWFALNGEQMINDITDYFKHEITNVRKESYNKGVQAARDGKVVFKPTKQSSKSSYDLDDFE
jgi:hypothetical protein